MYKIQDLFNLKKSSAVVFWGDFFLSLFLLISIMRFASYFIFFSEASLQADFSAYYTAGESLNNGLSPYKNFVHHQPPIWDGINRYKYSRFLYPPLVASFFQPLALLPYHTAKWLWGGLGLASVALTFFIVEKFFPAFSFRRLLLACIFTLWYFPLLAHVERGQIDVFTLLLLTLAIEFMTRKDKVKDLLSGGLFAFAALLKLYAILFLPFIFLQKRFRVLYGFLLGWVLILILTVILQGGPAHLADYTLNHLPRIANIGDIAKSDTLVNTKPIKEILSQTPVNYDTMKDGRGYLIGALNFSANATLVEPIRDNFFDPSRTSKVGITIVLYALFGAIIFLWSKYFFPSKISPVEEYLYWQIPAVITLLVSPITWTMNMVWLLPLFSVCIYFLSTRMPVSKKIGIAIIFFALLTAMMADNTNLPLLSHIGSILGGNKYVYSEILTLAGLLLFLGEKSTVKK